MHFRILGVNNGNVIFSLMSKNLSLSLFIFFYRGVVVQMINGDMEQNCYMRTLMQILQLEAGQLQNSQIGRSKSIQKGKGVNTNVATQIGFALGIASRKH